MRNRIDLAIGLMAVVAAMCLGCAGRISMAPDVHANPLMSACESQSRGHEFCWGIYDIRIDPSSGEVQVAPVRGTTFEANVTKWLQPPITPTELLNWTVMPGSDVAFGQVLHHAVQR